MCSAFTHTLDIIKQWPAMGPTASQRLFNAFLSRESTLSELKRLVSFFEKYTPCPRCHAPKMDTDCNNCIGLEACSSVLVLAHAVDFLLLGDDFLDQKIAFLMLQGYINPLTQNSPDNIKITQSLTSLMPTLTQTQKSFYILFNQSLEARGTLWFLRSMLPSTAKIVDLSSLLGAKEALFVLHPKELSNYKKLLLENIAP